MARFFTTLITSLGLTLIVSCSSMIKESDNRLSTNIVEKPTRQVLGVNADGVVIRTAPREESEKLINERATEAFGETQYCQVDHSTKVEVLETKDDWSKIKVVEPHWLSESHQGWIPSSYLVFEEHEEKKILGELDPREYEILKTDHKPVVENFHVLLKRPNFDKNDVHQFIKQFRKENCSKNCNVLVYDDKSVLPLVDIYPLTEKDYLKLADHFVSMSTFDAIEVRDWYPYQDFQYKEYGGKNWKKEPIK